MYISKRIFSVFVFVIGTTLFCVLASRQKSNFLKKSIAYIIFLCVLALMYIPGQGADLYRQYISMDIYSSLEKYEFLLLLRRSSTPISLLMLRFFGGIPIKNAMSVLATVVYFGGLFYMLLRIKKKYNVENKHLVIAFMFFMISGKYLNVISGIRNQIAFAIVTILIFREIFDKKNILFHIPLYIVSMLIHNTALIIVAIRLLSFIFLKKIKWQAKFLNLILLSLASYLAIKYGGQILSGATEKGLTYIQGSVYSSLQDKIMTYLYSFFIFETIHLLKKYKIKELAIINISRIILLVQIFALLFSFEDSILIRFQGFALYLFIPVLAYLFKYLQDNKIKAPKIYTFSFYIISLLIFIIEFSLGNITGLRIL